MLSEATKTMGQRVHTVKIKLHPRDAAQAAHLRQLFGIARWTYNEAVRLTGSCAANEERRAVLDSGGKPPSWLKYLRSKVLNNDSPAVTANPWLKQLGYDIRDAAVKEVLAGRKGGFTRMQNGTIDHFGLRFRSRKKLRSETMELRSRYIEQLDNAVLLKLPNQKPVRLWTGCRAF
jgi:Helix-turn-helix domain